MKHEDKVKAIQFIRPDAQFVLVGDEVNWLDENQTEPTKSEIDAGLKAYEAAEKAKLNAKNAAKSALFEKLGISEDEAKLLLS
jgi:hypothetical protein